MLLKKIIVFCLILPLVAFAKPKITEELKINPLDLGYKEQIVHFSKLYGGDEKIALAVAHCESNGKHSAIGDGGHSRGIYQFQKSTFLRMEKEFGEDLDYGSRYDQIKLGSWALAQKKYQNEWTTFVAIKKGGKYSFYSSLNKRHYTVSCKIV